LSPHKMPEIALWSSTNGAIPYFLVLPGRVPGLPVRDCTGSCSSCAQMCTNLKTMDVIEMTFFERLYLVPGVGTFVLCVNCPYASTTPTHHITASCRFPCNFFPRMAPQFFCLHDSPSNLAESRYPLAR